LPIVSVWTPRTPVLGDKLVSADGHAALLSFGLTTEFMETANMVVVEKLLEIIEEFKKLPGAPPGLVYAITGSGVVGGDILIATENSIRNTESATIVLVLIMLLVVYQAPLLVVVPIVTIGVSVWVALKLCALLAMYPALNFQIFTTSQVFIVVILFGAGTDFCLFLISRYKENLDHGFERTDGLVQALDQVAHVVSASAFTTICGLGVMWFGLFGKYHYTGPTIGLCLTVALAASVTLAPALLQMFGSTVFWPFRERHTREEIVQAKLQERTGHGVWTRLAKVVMDYPGVILAVSVVAMLPFAAAAWRVVVSFDALAELPPDRPSVFGTELIDKHFSQGDNGPVVVVVYRKEGGLNDKEGRNELAKLTNMLWEMRSPEGALGNDVKEGVREVRSIAEPLGGKPGVVNPFSAEGRAKMSSLRHPRTIETYMSTVPKLAGKVTQMEVVLAYNPFSRKAEEWVAKLEAALKAERERPNSYWKNASFDLGGVSSGIRDLNATTSRDLVVIQPLVVLVVFGVLIALLRDVVVCIYLMISVLFSYYVTLGATELLFAWLYAPNFDGLDWKVPLFLFVILVAVGMDYNIYLVARVVEEQKKRGPIEGIRFALVRTGGIITSCGMIMAGTFLTMTSGHLKGLTELGFALGFGVLLDTFFVRTLLVPAFLTLLYQHLRHTPPPDTGITHVEDVEGDRMEESLDREVEQIIRESGGGEAALDLRRSKE
ncbi:MAG TPA: MMPL family transporter, partial [Pirellulales bacterium]